MPVELTVILKDEERTYKQKFLVYEDLLLTDPPNSFMMGCITQAQANFKGEPEDISIRCLQVLK